MKEPRGHHYVSELILKRFTDANCQLHLFDKRRRKNGVFISSPIDAFKKRDLNSIARKDGSRNFSLESGYGELESIIEPVVQKVVHAVRAFRKPELTAEEKNYWDNFFYHQGKRHPEAFEELGLYDSLHDELPRFVAEWEAANRPLSDDEKANIFSDDGHKWIRQAATVRARAAPGKDVIAELSTIGLAFARIENHQKSFIIASKPILGLDIVGVTGARSGKFKFWFPVAHDIAIGYHGSAGGEVVFQFSSDEVRAVNRGLFEQSNLIAGRSEKLVASLAGLR